MFECLKKKNQTRMKAYYNDDIKKTESQCALSKTGVKIKWVDSGWKALDFYIESKNNRFPLFHRVCLSSLLHIREPVSAFLLVTKECERPRIVGVIGPVCAAGENVLPSQTVENHVTEHSSTTDRHTGNLTTLRGVRQSVWCNCFNSNKWRHVYRLLQTLTEI